MSGLIESATAVMRAAERRLELVSQNVANAGTPGFRAQAAFATLMDAADATPRIETRSSATRGKLETTGNPLDIAIAADGWFQVRADDGMRYTRQGSFALAADGTVRTPAGHTLQQAGGGDLVLDGAGVKIDEDGAVLDGGRTLGRIGVFATDGTLARIDGATFRALGDVGEVAEPGVRQGVIEASNVSVADEMVATMAAIREAEGGAKLIQAYDDLMGRAITAFGQAGR